MRRAVIRVLLLLAAFVVASPPPVLAKDAAAPTVSGARDEAKIPFKASSESDGAGMAVRVIGGFLFVALLAVASIYALKRFFPSFYVHSTGTAQHIRVIEIRRLTARTTLFLVELDGSRMLLAQSGDQLVNLHKTSVAPSSDHGATPNL
jgi:flagellar biogenesis protein FliO